MEEGVTRGTCIHISITGEPRDAFTASIFQHLKWEMESIQLEENQPHPHISSIMPCIRHHAPELAVVLTTIVAFECAESDFSLIATIFFSECSDLS